MNPNEIYNKMFRIINEQGSNYFSGERFISLVKEVDADFPDYSTYIAKRTSEGKSTARKDYFRDIFLSLSYEKSLNFAKRIEKETRLSKSKETEELYFLLYGKLPENMVKKPEEIKHNSDMETAIDSKKVFVVHGRNSEARSAMFRFLRSIDLNPLEWSEAVELTGNPSANIFEILVAGFSVAQAVLILFTPDDEARLLEPFQSSNDERYEKELTPQARQNVIFEAGMAMGMFPKRTVLVEIGKIRPMSDISGIHIIRMNNKSERRQELANRLKLAGCSINLIGTDWHSEGDFDASVKISEARTSLTINNAEIPQPISRVKSSNLRIKKTFSDREKDDFESKAFEFIADFFETSLQELESANSHISTNFRRVDANNFTATIYVDGSQANTCNIRISADGIMGSGITYSQGRSGGHSINDSLSVVDDGYELSLKHFSFSYSAEKEVLTLEEAAEHYWGKFIKPLQR